MHKRTIPEDDDGKSMRNYLARKELNEKVKILEAPPLIRRRGYQH